MALPLKWGKQAIRAADARARGSWRGFIPNNPLGRHSGAGRNPAIKNAPQSGQNNGVVPLMWEFVNQLDTGLRRYDTVSSNGLFGFMAYYTQWTSNIIWPDQ